MSDEKNGPDGSNVTDGSNSTDGPGDESLREIIEEADAEHGDDGAGAMADHLRDRVEETSAEHEEPGDVED